MKKFNIKAPVVFYAGILLLCMALISSYMTSDLYARYTTSSYGGDSARVAKFKVNYTVKIEDDTVSDYSQLIDLGEIQPGGTGNTISVTVTNGSEVAVHVKVYVYNATGNLPLNVPNKGTPNAEPIGTSSALAPGGTETYYFNIIWPSVASAPSAAGKTDILELKIIVEQVD